MRIRRILKFAGIAVLLHSAAWGQYAITHSVVGNGDGQSSGGGVYLNGTVGQQAVGLMSGAGYGQKAGYWYVVDRLHIGPTSDVLISTFNAQVVEGRVQLNWTTGGGAELRGFNVYRSDGENGPFTKLNNELIAGDHGNSYCDARAKPGTTYWYQLGAVDADGETYSVLVSVSIPPGKTTLYQNYPNPFNPVTTVSFYLPRPERVVLTIYDVKGERVRVLADGIRDFGRYDLSWDGRNDEGESVGSGVYFYRLIAGKTVLTKKLTLLK